MSGHLLPSKKPKFYFLCVFWITNHDLVTLKWWAKTLSTSRPSQPCRSALLPCSVDFTLTKHCCRYCCFFFLSLFKLTQSMNKFLCLIRFLRVDLIMGCFSSEKEREKETPRQSVPTERIKTTATKNKII